MRDLPSAENELGPRPRKPPVMRFSTVTMRHSRDGVTCCSSYPGGSFLTHWHREPHGWPTRPAGVDRCERLPHSGPKVPRRT